MSAIEWTDVTWNPVTGCTRVSDGCLNCYIEQTPGRIDRTRTAPHPPPPTHRDRDRRGCMTHAAGSCVRTWKEDA